MPEQTLEDHHLKLSIERRAERLIPMARAAVRGHAPTPSPETVRQYEAAWKRMQARDLAPEEIAPRSRRSYNLYRAALVYRALTILKQAPDYWDEYGQTASAKRAHAFLNLVEQYLNILRHYPPGARDAKSLWRRPPGGPVRKGKRRGLSRLPANWRLIMAAKCPASSGYRDAVLVLALTGLRPAELTKGVVVDASQNAIRVTIQGAKVTAISGQPLRQILFNADMPIAKAVHALAARRNGRLLVSAPDPRAFCDFIRGLSREIFPAAGYVVSPYSFRHAFAADRKAQGVSKEALALMLGHVSERSQQAYGVARQGRGPLALVREVVASRAVRSVGAALEQQSPFKAPQI